MLHLSTQDVVLSIEKTQVVQGNNHVYQKYYNFFGNTNDFNVDLGKVSFDKLENQENEPRKRLSYNEGFSKQLHIFFMNSKITNALIKKFNTDLRFKSVDIWTDNKGYYIPPHIDDSGIKLALQIYLSEDNIGTSLYNKDKKIKTFTFEPNSGYALLNTKNSFHGVDKIEKEGRISLYARYS